MAHFESRLRSIDLCWLRMCGVIFLFHVQPNRAAVGRNVLPVLLSLRTPAMGAFLYRCPNTGFRVQGWVEDDQSEDSDEAYVRVVCHACGRLHLVNPKTGQTASSNDK
jgi:hypothetical protein